MCVVFLVHFQYHVYHTSYLCENLRHWLENENDDGVIIASAIKYTKINELKIF